MRRIERLMLTTLLAGATATASAQDVSAALAHCRAEQDAGARLACYDQLADDTSPSSSATAASGPDTPDTSAASGSAAPDTSSEGFGHRGGALARAEAAAREEAERTEKTGESEQVSGTVTEVSRRASGELVLTLDNGQTWMQKAPDRKFIVKNGDRVRIEAGTLRSYTMYRADSKRGTRVTRVR